MQIEPHILFADDDRDIRELVQAVLQAAGFRVSTTDTTTGVLELAAAERFDVMLLDYWMLQLTGFELCRRIRVFDQATPILICSGVINQADRQEAVGAGAQGYVTKPFRSKDLIGALRSLLQN